ncbi:MAG: prepilin peptidase [Blautia sp.]|nr:prepilin peptidase [Blautia sp.]
MFDLIPVLLSAGAVVMDVKSARISNRWILMGLAGAFLGQLLRSGGQGILAGMKGFCIPFLLLGWLFPFRMMGAGDIKLLCVLGVFLGPERILFCLMWTMGIGAVFSLIRLCTKKMMRQRVLYFFRYLRNFLITKEIVPYRTGGWERPENMPFTIPILLGILLGFCRAY